MNTFFNFFKCTIKMTCVYECGYVCHGGMCLSEDRLWSGSLLLPLHGFPGLNLGCQTWVASTVTCWASSLVYKLWSHMHNSIYVVYINIEKVNYTNWRKGRMAAISLLFQWCSFIFSFKTFLKWSWQDGSRYIKVLATRSDNLSTILLGGKKKMISECHVSLQTCYMTHG